MKYRKVDPRIWNDERFARLSQSGKLVFLFLLTHPHMTSVGAMRASIEGLAAELKMSAEAFREAFREGCSEGMIEIDESACFIGLPKFIKYNRPESPNVLKAWSDAFDLLPECQLKRLLFQRLKAFAKAFGQAFAKAFAERFGEAFREPSPIPEPEPEPEPEEESTHTHGAASSPITERFEPDSACEALAISLGLDIQAERANFIDHARETGRLTADHQAAFRRWMRKTATMDRNARAAEISRASRGGRYASSSQRNSANIRQVLAEVGVENDTPGRDQAHGHLGGNVRRASVGT